MSIWRRLAAATTDLSIGGQIGALIGGGSARDAAKRPTRPDTPDNEVPFTVGVIMLSAKMAKADGSVTSDEVTAFKEAFKVSAAEMKHAAPVFNLAKRDASDYGVCAQQLVDVFRGDRNLLEDVLDGLFHIAKADDEVHPQEAEFLGEVAKVFGLTGGEFNVIKARHLVPAKRNPYDVLGVDPSVGEAELERHYRALMEGNQPDKLLARGVPKEFVAIATEKAAALREAYDAIRKERAA
jgi:DnaJ like chaperone protein